MEEKIVEIKKCKHCESSFDVTDKDLEFYDKVSPIFAWKKYSIPTPSLCPDCRLKRRLSFRNERRLYKNKCDCSWKDIISMYSPDKTYTVYNQEYWWSDKWNTLDYWKYYDESKSFLEQLNKIIFEVPKLNLSTETQENTEYSNYAWWNKNSYLIFLWANNERCYYCNWVWFSKNTLESSFSRYLENCYNIIDSKNCYNCSYSSSLDNCSNCIFCYNLKWKKYYIFNKEVTKKDYEDFIKNWIYAHLNNYFEYRKKIIYPSNQNYRSENITWEYVIDSKNSFNCFEVVNIKDCKYCWWLFDSNNCYDVYDWWATAEYCLDSHKIWDKASNILFSAFCFSNVNNLLYCYDCVNNCSNCFWCVWLKNKSYCILNKQYTKQEYEELVPKIIEKMIEDWEWWEFFPASISPFGYNETVANEYFPLDKDESLKAWFNWSDYEPPKPNVEKIIPASKLPDSIEDIPDDILNRAIECEVTKKPFRIIKQELEFYRKHNLPIPRRHPDQRHLDRMALRNPRKLYDRKCDKCKKDIKTTYAPDRSEIVYCEKCYNEYVY